MQDLRFSLFLAKDGWAVYELATRRIVELDGVAQAGLRFAAAEQAARLLNSFGCDIASADRPALLHS